MTLAMALATALLMALALPGLDARAQTPPAGGDPAEPAASAARAAPGEAAVAASDAAGADAAGQLARVAAELARERQLRAIAVERLGESRRLVWQLGLACGVLAVVALGSLWRARRRDEPTEPVVPVSLQANTEFAPDSRMATPMRSGEGMATVALPGAASTTRTRTRAHGSARAASMPSQPATPTPTPTSASLPRRPSGRTSPMARSSVPPSSQTPPPSSTATFAAGHAVRPAGVAASRPLPPVGPAATVVPLREVNVEELMDLEQQVEFFMVIGQHAEAVELLASHVRASGGTSAVALLKLLDVHHASDDRTGYERERQRIEQRFNVRVPDFDAGPGRGAGLEESATALARLQQRWPAPLEALVEIERLLARHDGGEPFDIPAYRELLLLHAIAREHVSADAAMPGADVDVLLPLGDLGDLGDDAPPARRVASGSR